MVAAENFVEIRARHLEQQTEQAWCPTPTTNAVIAWTTECCGLAVVSMRAAGRRIDDEVLAHIPPARSENINFFGAIEVDIDAELSPRQASRPFPFRSRAQVSKKDRRRSRSPSAGETVPSAANRYSAVW